MDFGDDVEEERHFGDIVLSLTEYVADAEAEFARRERAFGRLDPRDRARFPADYPNRFWTLRECAKTNQVVLDRVAESFLAHAAKRAREQGPRTLNGEDDRWAVSPAYQMSKVRSTLHQIAREWSAEGKRERDACFGPILSELQARLPSRSRVAIPGVGLGRLAAEVAGRGFQAQGSEFSYHMLLTGDMIMNRLHARNELTLHPWIDQPSNVRSFADHVRPVAFPDMTCPEILLQSGAGASSSSARENLLSICAGEFVDIYSRQHQLGAWDAVVFCFFLDTASNVCEYLSTAHAMLRSGGFLLSLGPLLWHFQPEHGGGAGASSANTDSRYAESVEVTFEDILHLLTTFGFEVVHQVQIPNVQYAANRESIMSSCFQAQFLVARKI